MIIIDYIIKKIPAAATPQPSLRSSRQTYRQLGKHQNNRPHLHRCQRRTMEPHSPLHRSSGKTRQRNIPHWLPSQQVRNRLHLLPHSHHHLPRKGRFHSPRTAQRWRHRPLPQQALRPRHRHHHPTRLLRQIHHRQRRRQPQSGLHKPTIPTGRRRYGYVRPRHTRQRRNGLQRLHRTNRKIPQYDTKIVNSDK